MTGVARTWLRRHILAADAIVAAAVFVVGVLSIRIFFDLTVATPQHFRFATGMACMSVLTLSLALRRKAAPVMLVGVTLGMVGYTVFGVSDDSLVLTVVFMAIYSVGAYCEPRVANPVRAACITVMFVDVVRARLVQDFDLHGSGTSVLGAALMAIGVYAVFFALAWALGDVARTARLHAVELGTRNSELRAAQAVIAEKAILDERVRIARELHDVVAHHVSVMGVQAGAARRLMAGSPDQAGELLSGIEESSRQAVAELQRLLGFLRSQGADGPDTSASRPAAPLPSLAGLDALVAQMNEAGLVVSTGTDGASRPLPATVDLSAYRVVQEALTNALKHSGVGTAVTVTLAHARDRLEVSVVDDGRGRSNGRTGRFPVTGGSPAPPTDHGPPAGHGLPGMRERVALHGGSFSAGPRRGSGFAVRATFPLAELARESAS